MEEEVEMGVEEEKWALSRCHMPFIHSANSHSVRQSPKAHRSEQHVLAFQKLFS